MALDDQPTGRIPRDESTPERADAWRAIARVAAKDSTNREASMSNANETTNEPTPCPKCGEPATHAEPSPFADGRRRVWCGNAHWWVWSPSPLGGARHDGE